MKEKSITTNTIDYTTGDITTQEKRKQLSTEHWLVAGSLSEMDSFIE
jgi:hypothetical protein